MKKLISLVLSSLWVFEAHAQKIDPATLTDISREAENNSSSFYNTLNFIKFDTRYQGLKGSYYLFREPMPAIAVDQKKSYKNLKVNFDCVNQEFVMFKPNGDSVAIYPTSLQIIDSSLQTTFKFILMEPSVSGATRGYYQVLSESKPMIIKKVKKKYDPAKFGGAYDTHNKTFDSFEDASEYLVIDQNPRYFKPTAIGVSSLFNDKKKVRQYINDHKLDMKNEVHLSYVINKFKNDPTTTN